MALELVYTSAAKGLRAGTSGFCTVAMTKGFPPALVPRLEALGGYRAGPSGDGPLSYCFWRVETATGIAHVLSIVGPAPPDHTARTNKIATYLVLAPEELVAAGPAALLARAGLLRREWSGAPAWIEQAVRVPAVGDASPRPCTAWQAAAGDAGWAGVLASNFLRDQSKPIHVIYGAGIDPLPLVDEAIRLLPDWARWRATFSTYFLQPVAGTPCAWRFCLEGTPAADAARQSKGLLIDLTRTLGAVPDSRFTRMARTGIDEEAVAAAAKARAPSRTAAAKAADAPIGLAPDTDHGERRPGRLPLVLTDDHEAAPEVPAAQPVKPVMIALVAAVLTLLLLLVIVLVSSGTKGKPPVEAAESAAPAPAAEPAPAGTGAAAAPMKAPALTLSPDGVPEKPAEPAPTAPSPPDVDPAPAAPDASSPPPTEAPAPVAPAPQRNSAPPQESPKDVPPAVPAVAAVPSVPATPVPPAPAAAMPVAQWTMSFSGGSGADTLYARSDATIAKARSARIVLPKELADAGAKVGDRNVVTFGAPTLRAVPQVDGGVVKVAVTASGAVPDALAALVGGKQSDAKPLAATVAVQRALERCTVEVLDAAGMPLGSAQMRPRVAKPIAFTAKPGKAPTIVPDVADVPLSVQLLAGGAGERPVVIATDRSIPGRKVEFPVGEWLRVVVDRGLQKSGIVVTASLPVDLAARKGTITAGITALRALSSACIAVRDGAKGLRRGSSYEADLQAVQNALTDEEHGRIAPGAARNLPLTDAAAIVAAVDAVEPRTAAALDAASRSLAELSQVNADRPKLPARVVVRISNDDGIVLLESEVKVVSGGGS